MRFDELRILAEARGSNHERQAWIHGRISFWKRQAPFGLRTSRQLGHMNTAVSIRAYAVVVALVPQVTVPLSQCEAMRSRPSSICPTSLVARFLGHQRSPRGAGLKAHRNPALGYAIDIPRGLKGRTGDQLGPERGFQITLPSGGKIVVYAQPNSLEWKSPAEAASDYLDLNKCPAGRSDVSVVRVGGLSGAEGTLTCAARLIKIMIAFHEPTDLVYVLQLETVTAHADADVATLSRLASSLRMIRRE